MVGFCHHKRGHLRQESSSILSIYERLGWIKPGRRVTLCSDIRLATWLDVIESAIMAEGRFYTYTCGRNALEQ